MQIIEQRTFYSRREDAEVRLSLCQHATGQIVVTEIAPKDSYTHKHPIDSMREYLDDRQARGLKTVALLPVPTMDESVALHETERGYSLDSLAWHCSENS